MVRWGEWSLGDGGTKVELLSLEGMGGGAEVGGEIEVSREDNRHV